HLAIVAARPVTTVETFGAITTILPLRAFVGSGLFTRFDHLFLALVLVHLLIALTTRILFLEPSTVFAEHPKIVIGVLQIIFGLDSVARKLGVARHALVFFEQLRGVAALAIVLPVPRLSAEVLAPLSTTTASAAALTIVDQMPTSLRSVVSPLHLRQ